MTRKIQETTTIQLWPSGQSITFRGDPHGNPRRRSIRTKSGKWVRGSAQEWRAIRIEQRAEGYRHHEILCCDSALVGALCKISDSGRDEIHRAFGYDEIRNLYADPTEWDAAQCREYLDDHGVAYGACNGDGCLGAADPDCPDHSLKENVADHLRELCRDYAKDNPAEVFEWWRVSEWLCGQLHAIGEVTIANEYGCWWGRTCTWQGLIMDGTLQRIARQSL